MNNVCILGRLTSNAELKYTPGGMAFTGFSIAFTEKRKDSSGNIKENASFFRCEAWGKTAEIIAEHFKKGQRILINGKLKQNNWEDKEGYKHSSVVIVVSLIDFIENKEKSETKRSAEKPQGSDLVDPIGDDINFPEVY